MSRETAASLKVLADIIQQFRLSSLIPSLQACEALAGGDALVDVAVLGQFKSGKSSLLNTVLGQAIFPVGALPVTAVITRATAGLEAAIRVRHLDGRTIEVPFDKIALFVTEAGNPRNQRQVDLVDVFVPAMSAWPGVRLVDTPGLGSVLAHNTEAARAWMPHAAVALVTVSAERPLSDDDRRLVEEARQIAPRVVVVLTKVDLLTDAELLEVTTFVEGALREALHATVTVLPFSSHVEPERWANRLRGAVLTPVAKDAAGEGRAALDWKLAALQRAARGYLTVGLRAAEQADADRDGLRAAVLDESVNAGVIRDELRLAEQRVCNGLRSAFEAVFLEHRTALTKRIRDALAAESLSWHGNLAQQAQQYHAWLADRLMAELEPLCRDAAQPAAEWLGQGERRLGRVVEGFRDRLSRNIRETMGLTISPANWDVKRPRLEVVPVAVGQPFMTNWELLWWFLPMWLVGGLFRRHVVGRVPWEVEKNLVRLAGDWAAAVDATIHELARQASAWVDSELAMLQQLLGPRPTEATAFREALQRLDTMDACTTCANVGRAWS